MPAPVRLEELTWTEVDALPRERIVAILPVGACEAHGPHLPTSTDVIIAEAMATAGAGLLADAGHVPLLLPSLPYTAAPFAAEFPGTVSVRPETLTALAVDVATGLSAHGVRLFAFANAHLDPAHLRSLHEAVAQIEGRSVGRVAFPDLTRKPWASRLTDEFASGACHAGRYEGSIVLATRPELVRREVARRLAPNAVSLARAIADGKTTFREAGGDRAYFGDPAAASAREGRETVQRLGEILAEAVAERVRLG